MKILDLVLKAKYYEITGEAGKMFELRKPSRWILSRLFDSYGDFKFYDQVRLRCGYAKGGFVKYRKFVTWDFLESDKCFYLPSGEILEGKKGDIIIHLENLD